MTVPPISTATFACELCDHVHTSGEAPFRINRFHCSEVGDTAGCIERLKVRHIQTCGHTKRAWIEQQIERLEDMIDPRRKLKRTLVGYHHLHTVKPAKLEKLWNTADLWFADLGENVRDQPDADYAAIVDTLLKFGRVW